MNNDNFMWFMINKSRDARSLIISNSCIVIVQSMKILAQKEVVATAEEIARQSCMTQDSTYKNLKKLVNIGYVKKIPIKGRNRFKYESIY